MSSAERWFLHSSGCADARPSDGSLSTVAPTMEPVDSFNCGTTADAFGGDGGHGLRYSSPVFLTPLAVDGAVRFELHAASSGDGVEYTAMVVDHGPDRRDTFVGSSTAAAGAGAASVTLEFGTVTHTFGVGHRLRIDISATGRDGLTALQVFHDAVRPSCLVLAVG
jgi:hypothetical protein